MFDKILTELEQKLNQQFLDEILATILEPQFNHQKFGPPLEELEKESAYLQLFKTVNNGHEKREEIRI